MTCTMASLINGHWLKIQPHATSTVVLIDIRLLAVDECACKRMQVKSKANFFEGYTAGSHGTMLRFGLEPYRPRTVRELDISSLVQSVPVQNSQTVLQIDQLWQG